MSDLEELTELLIEGRDHATGEEALAALILKSEWLRKRDAEKWQEGAEALATATLPNSDHLTNPYLEKK